MSARDAILFANDAFYTAFRNGSFEQMQEVWAPDREITCIHPGWRPLTDREQIMESWEVILSSSVGSEIQFLDPTVIVLDDVAYVTGFEAINGRMMSTTNLFVRDGSVWRMVHHQGGPCQDHIAADFGVPDRTLQ